MKFSILNSKNVFFVAILLISATELAFGWGQTGHRVVGEVAQHHLSKKAEKALVQIFGKNQSLAEVSNWMDNIKSDSNYRHTYDWHWVTIPDGMKYEDTEKNPKGDLIATVERCVLVLKSDTALLISKQEALKMLVHLIGDLHQPLHVGNGTDRGGNSKKVKWFSSSYNLHKVWDSGMIDRKDWSYTELTKVVNDATLTQIDQWKQGDVRDWAHEAMTYRTQVYNTFKKESLSYNYMYYNWDLVEQQLVKGGVRLAALLNSIYQ